ncbi:MAG: RNA polymerase sigma factor [Deltaproteobacteria bacterium]|nr:RNA polymerase sigma factor [Nannocystaceae bacterium]
MSHDLDRALVAAVLRGDARAEQTLVRRLLPHLRAVSRAILGDGADADDGVQVALMRVLERASSYRGEAPIERWSRTVAVRACLRLAEGNRRHRATDDPDDDALGLSRDDEDDTLIDTLPGPIAAYLDRLPAAQREALVLRHALGYSVAEIAELASVPLDTVKSRLMFGLRALRRSIRRDQLPRLREAGARGGRHG